MEQWEDLVAAIVATTPLSRPDAEDVLQDFAVDLLDAVIVVSAEPESWLAYIKRALRNRALNKHRDETRAERRVQDGTPPDWLIPRRNLLNEGIAVREVFLDAMTDLRRLPDAERELFLLRYWEDLKPKQIAERTGLTTKQVDKRLQQAKERLAKMRADRRETGAYALLALILRPVTRHEPSTVAAGQVTSGVMSFAAVVAFSLVTTTTGGVPSLSPAGSPTSQVHAAALLGAGSHERGTSALSWSARAVVGAARAGQPDPSRTAFRGLAQRLPVAPCTKHVCVGAGGTGLPGDTIIVTAAGEDYYVNQSATPVCEYVPGNPAVHCERQEPEQWVVKEVPPPPPAGGTSL